MVFTRERLKNDVKKIIKGKLEQFGSGTGVRFGTTGSIRGTVSNY